MLDMHEVMRQLAKDRPVFHSEADFQHALAWKLHQRNDRAKIRLERRFHVPDKAGKPRNIYLDIWHKLDNHVTAIELKYQTVSGKHEHDDEQFELRNQGAEDNLGYDFINDIVRIEDFTRQHPGSIGYAILLSNESLCWRKPKGTGEYNKDAFRIHEGRALSGTLSWRKPEGDWRNPPHVLSGNYQTEWQDYPSPLAVGFRFLCINVGALME